MKKKMIFAVITLLVFGIVVPSVYSQETEEPIYKGSGKGEAIMFDLFFLRPVALISCGVGFATTIIGAPFIVGREDARDIGDALLNEPGNYAVIRPLGKY
ncbi:MAG: hypothetical protein H6R39_318 [Deltaproteobacteria bacterium]|jgi:hypothetical protein|nr:hypothetical protein [Deltaproteobacteria bacterium]